MRKVFVIVFLAVFSYSVQAQTWDEWFKQRKTQREYLLKQIAALQVYLGYLQKGYEIASEGLSVINDIKNGDFNLHDGFFNSLKVVKPSIKNSAAVTDVISVQRQIVKQGKSVMALIKTCDQYTDSEASYLKKVVDRLLDDCLGTLTELMMVITNGELEMKDDERTRRIEKIRRDMEEKYLLCRSFVDDARMLAAQRLTEQLEVGRSKKFFGLH